MITTVSNNLKTYLKQKEALRLKAYKLSGENGYTIGYGNKFYENGTAVKSTDTITATRAAQLFENILAGFAREVRKAVTSDINQGQFDALVSYAYNRGIGAFKASYLLKLVNANPNDSRIPNQFVIEWGSNTEYKDSLIARRKQEAAMYASGGGTNSTTGITIVSIAVLAYAIYRVIK